MLRPINRIASHKTPTADDLNILISRLNSLSHVSTGSGLISNVSPMGISLLTQGIAGLTGTAGLHKYLKVFEVQSEATGDGVYNCVLMALDATEWEDTAGDDKYVYGDEIYPWTSGRIYTVDTIVSHNSTEYACKVQHTSSAANEPPNSTYWMKLYEWGYATEAWDSGHGTYNEGDRVEYNSKDYICIQTHTAAVGKEPADGSEYWDETYKTGDYVYKLIKDSRNYFKCTSTHVSDTSKEPPDTTYWSNIFEKEILNLLENNPAAAYMPCLVEGDRIQAWQVFDDEGTVRWVGIPLISTTRRAQIQSVGATSLTVKLLNNAGSPVGNTITVLPIKHLGSNALDGDVWPDLEANDIISVFQDISGYYRTTFVFDDTTTCT